MKTFIFLVAIAGFVGCQSQTVQKSGSAIATVTQPSHDHGGGHSDHAKSEHDGHKMEKSLTLLISPHEVVAGKPTNFTLMVHDDKGNMLKDFEATHEKLVHLIFIDKLMATFYHIHPEVAPDGKMTVTHAFATGGDFYVYADVKPRGKETETVRSTLMVKGESPSPASLASTVPDTVKGDGWSANVSVTPVRVGESTVMFEFKDGEAKPLSDLQPYLGAMGHLVVVNVKDGDYAHAHPDAKSSAPGEVRFMVHFAKPGIYKGWGQFKRGEKVFDVPFVAEIK